MLLTWLAFLILIISRTVGLRLLYNLLKVKNLTIIICDCGHPLTISDRSIRCTIEIDKKCLIGFNFFIASDAKANSFKVSPGLETIVPSPEL